MAVSLVTTSSQGLLSPSSSTVQSEGISVTLTVSQWPKGESPSRDPGDLNCQHIQDSPSCSPLRTIPLVVPEMPFSAKGQIENKDM